MIASLLQSTLCTFNSSVINANKANPTRFCLNTTKSQAFYNHFFNIAELNYSFTTLHMLASSHNMDQNYSGKFVEETIYKQTLVGLLF